jgi:hypothetical protein
LRYHYKILKKCYDVINIRIMLGENNANKRKN